MTKTITLPNAQLIPAIKQLIDEGHTATFRVRGRSMRPFLEDCRDKAVMAPPVRDMIKRGDVVLAEISPKLYVLHRVVKREGDSLTLRGDGNVYGTETCKVEDVIGVATGFVRHKKEKLTSVRSLKWRIYSATWPDNSFIRRCLLAFNRLVILRLFGK